jgi:hypothetical protein
MPGPGLHQVAPLHLANLPFHLAVLRFAQRT